MNKLLLSAVSGFALLFGATLATAQEKNATPAKDPAVSSPGSGAIKMDGSKKDDEATQRNTDQSSTMDKSTSHDRTPAADRGSYKSYSSDKSSASGAAIAGGYSADQLIGSDVLNASGKSVGEIEDLLVDSNNKVDKAIVEVGGFLGIGSKYVAVDIEKLNKDSKSKNFTSDMTKDSLKALPEYEKEKGMWVTKADTK